MATKAIRCVLALALVACGAAHDEGNPGSDAPAVTGSNAPTAGGGGGGEPSKSPPPSVGPCRTDLGPALASVGAPGLAAAIVKNGKLVCASGAGFANVEEKRPVTPDTLFLWASVSKTIVATSVMQLFDEGKLALDDDVSRYLPFSVRVPSCPGTPVTIRHLLTHTSSIVDRDAVLAAEQTIGSDSKVPLLDFVESYLTPGGSRYSKSSFTSVCPGTKYAYSNVGATLLGAIVQSVAKAPFEQITQERIFAPLGMNETAWHLADLDLGHVAMPYVASATGFTAYGQYGEPDFPDGMMRTSVVQLARFLAMNAQLGEYGGAQLIAKTTAEEMRRKQIPSIDDTQGLIWYYASFGSSSTNVIGHNGSDDGASSNMFYDPASGAGVVLVANADWNDDNDQSPAADALMDALFAEAKGY
jgi:CubicO group peptidase (beta-lactamase class C family)